MNRRDFLLGTVVAATSVAFEACVSPFLGSFHDKGTVYYMERRVNDIELQFNPTNRLKRYRGRPGDPETSESRLVQLARTELYEESFAFTLPEKVWYETGINERSKKVSSRASVLFENSGRGNLPKFESIYVYHYHPWAHDAKTAFAYAKLKHSSEGLDKIIEHTYKYCLRNAPPSRLDLIHGITLNKLARKRGIKLVQRVADIYGIWEYDYSKDFLQKIHNKNLTEEEFKNVHEAISTSYVEEFEDRGTPKGYLTRLKKNLQKLGLEGTELNFSYRPVNTSAPSLNQFKSILRNLGLVK